MASREAEKQRRREERLAKERESAAMSARRRRLLYAAGALGVVTAIAGAAVLAVSGLLSPDRGDPAPSAAADRVALPDQRAGDLAAAAKAAGCKVSNPPVEGQAHEAKLFEASDYNTNPPTSGTHHPEWYPDGVYEAGSAPEIGKQVHTLEHGRVNVQYRKGTSAGVVAQLEALLAEQSDGYHMLLYENASDMPYAVAATAWGRLVACDTMSDEVFDVLRTFRAEFLDKGPESVP